MTTALENGFIELVACELGTCGADINVDRLRRSSLYDKAISAAVRSQAALLACQRAYPSTRGLECIRHWLLDAGIEPRRALQVCERIGRAMTKLQALGKAVQRERNRLRRAIRRELKVSGKIRLLAEILGSDSEINASVSWLRAVTKAEIGDSTQYRRQASGYFALDVFDWIEPHVAADCATKVVAKCMNRLYRRAGLPEVDYTGERFNDLKDRLVSRDIARVMSAI